MIHIIPNLIQNFNLTIRGDDIIDLLVFPLMEKWISYSEIINYSFISRFEVINMHAFYAKEKM